MCVVAACAWLLAAGVLLAGCGTREQDDGPRPLSKREYIQQADALQRGAEEAFVTLDGRIPATPEEAATRIAALDEMIAGYEQLVPPRDWRDSHAQLLESLRTMRQSLQVVSRASAGNRRVIEHQVGRYESAQAEFEQAVRDINATR
jgi:hypothetical protein